MLAEAFTTAGRRRERCAAAPFVISRELVRIAFTGIPWISGISPRGAQYSESGSSGSAARPVRNRTMKSIIATLSVVLLSSAALAQEPATATAKFVDAKGEANGSAELSALEAGGVLIKLEVTGLPKSSWVAFHVHETGTCDHATRHESAGGHFNPGSKKHGFKVAGGPHAGDMPNQYVPADGTLRAEVFNPAVTLAAGEAGIRGRALMIHAKADDYQGQPAGNAGARVACGVIQ